MYNYDLFDFIKMNTVARLIDWKPTGEEVSRESHKKTYTRRGYEAEIDGFKIRTMISKKKLNSPSSDFVYAVSIEKDGEKIVYTDDRKVIPGELIDGWDLLSVCATVQHEMEARDLPNQLRQCLARLRAQA